MVDEEGKETDELYIDAGEDGSRNRVVSEEGKEKDDLEKEVDGGRVGAEGLEWRSGGWWAA